MRVEELGTYVVIVRFHVWVDQRTYSYRKVRSEAKRILKMALDEAGIKMPAPSREITVRKIGNENKSSGGRKQSRFSVTEAARLVDVSPEKHINRQIDEEISRSI